MCFGQQEITPVAAFGPGGQRLDYTLPTCKGGLSYIAIGVTLCFVCRGDKGHFYFRGKVKIFIGDLFPTFVSEQR